MKADVTRSGLGGRENWDDGEYFDDWICFGTLLTSYDPASFDPSFDINEAVSAFVTRGEGSYGRTDGWVPRNLPASDIADLVCPCEAQGQAAPGLQVELFA
jgi:hypothetical protein